MRAALSILLFLSACTLQAPSFAKGLQPAQQHFAWVKYTGNKGEHDTAAFVRTKLILNGRLIHLNDTNPQVIRLSRSGLDTGIVITDGDSLVFLMKLKENQAYLYEGGCCCALFSLRAEKNPARGFVRFNNRAKDTVLIQNGIDYDTLAPKKKSAYGFAYESAMCLYKPHYVSMLRFAYAPYLYMDFEEMEKRGIKSENYTVASTWFLFLHGEKVTATYDPTAQQKLKVELDGYAKSKEFPGGR